jgi:hypothetical protein
MGNLWNWTLTTGGEYSDNMKATVEARVDEGGIIRLTEAYALRAGSRLLVTVVQEPPAETALLSETSLAADWSRPEEDAAWAAFAQAQ